MTEKRRIQGRSSTGDGAPSVCGTLDREEELGATAAAFGASNSFLVESASVTVMGTVEVKGRQVADAKFDYEVRFVSHDGSVVVQASDMLMFISEDEGETWSVSDWVEAYPVRLQSVDDCASDFVGTRNNWLLAQATAVEELSLGVLKTRYRR